MKIAVIGAGYTGLSATYDFARAGHEVVMFEANDRPGGLAIGFKEPSWDWSVEAYYHHWFASDQHMLGLIEELGFSDKVRFPRPFTVMLHKGKFYPFDSIIQALLFPGLGWGINKIRFGLVGLYLRLTENWQAMEKITVDSWMRKWAGNKVYETMWEPMLKGKFGAHYKEVNMAWMWARIHARTSKLGTYQGGFQAFADDISNELKNLGVDIRLSTRVKRISEELIVETDQGQIKFDRILVTTSPGLLSKLVPTLPESFHENLRNLKSMGAVVLTLSLKHQLSNDGYYWYNLPKDQGFPFLAVVEHTNYLSPDYFGGDHIIYCGDYRDPDHEYFSLSKEEILGKFLPALKKINPDFDPSWVKKSWMYRASYAQPVPELNHSEKIPPIETPLSGLYFASMSQVYPWDRGTNFAVEIGRRAAALMMSK
ncbi:MAG: NAD(P)/FAD-dependent oxidoreductase [Anaerolineales bacterium]|nr:NAD(P)/FAD-dependent oxidoreductase [Anaerolineales bacterium]